MFHSNLCVLFLSIFFVFISRDIIWDKLKSKKPDTNSVSSTPSSQTSSLACPFVPKKPDSSKIPVAEPPKPKSPPPLPQLPVPPPPKQPPQSPVPPPPKQPPKLPPQVTQPPKQPSAFPPKPLEPPAKPPRSPSPHPIRAEAFDDDIEYDEDSEAEEDEDDDTLINSASRFPPQNQQKSGKSVTNDFIGQERKNIVANER